MYASGLRSAALGSLTVLALSLAVALTPAPAAHAQLTFFTSRVTFDAANPGLPIEGFQNGATTTQAFTGPLNSATNNAAFQTGDILPGLTIQDNPGPDTDGLFLVGAGQSTNPTVAVGSRVPDTDALDLLFSPSVMAVGLDLFQNFGAGLQQATAMPYTVSVFGVSGLLGTSSAIVAPNGGSFFGVSTIPGSEIVRVSILRSDAFEVIDNVAFGGTTVSATAPEPGSLALLALTGLPVVGAVMRRNRVLLRRRRAV